MNDKLVMLGRGTCVVLIGMAACGKSTVGRALADTLGLAHVDTDSLIEAAYGVRLQTVADALDKQTFLDAEGAVLSSLNLKKSVISTGGSACYREKAMRHLRELGIVIFIDTPLDILKERIARKPDRGLAIAAGQTIDDLYAERLGLYRKYSDWSLQNGGFTLEQTVQAIADWLGEHHPDLCVPARRD